MNHPKALNLINTTATCMMFIHKYLSFVFTPNACLLFQYTIGA